jgi:predicted methyltransferase
MTRPTRAALPLIVALAACRGAATPKGPPDMTGAAAARPAPAPSAPEHVTKVDVPAATKAVVEAPDRSEADRALDAGRRPAEMLAFFGVKPGMKVAELGAGGGYTAELLARAVGETGVVYGHNSPRILERFADKPWSERLAKPVNAKIVKVTRPFDDPLPPEAKDLDVVFCVLFYHDTFWLEVDRAKMNAAVFRALKPGGVYAIIDHSGRPGTFATEVKTLHRIEEKVVREEVEKAGFRLAAEADFLRNPGDERDWNDAPSAAEGRRGTSDRFVLKFVKP